MSDRPAADFITELKRLLGKDRTTIAKYKALICKLVEACEKTEAVMFGQEIKGGQSVFNELGAVIKEAKEVIK